MLYLKTLKGRLSKTFTLRVTARALHLLGWNLIRFAIDHENRLSISFCKIAWSSNQLISLHILVSSAYSAIFVPSETHENISLINITKSKGPNIEPCGTPEWTGALVEDSPPITTCCWRPWRYDFKKRSIKPSTPNWFFNFWRIISCDTVSKALAK